MWGYVGDNNLVVFDYTPTWEATGPRAFLRGFAGFVQGDGYAGFKTALTREDGDPIVDTRRRLGCGMHVRRKFEQAADAGDARGAIALAYFRKIYDVERLCKDQRLAPDARKQRREELSLPVVDELYAWVRELHPRLVPGLETDAMKGIVPVRIYDRDDDQARARRPPARRFEDRAQEVADDADDELDEGDDDTEGAPDGKTAAMS